MNTNKKEKSILKAVLKAHRMLEKAQRKTIKDPTKLCDCCMNEWTYFTITEEKLCDECYREKYVKT
jgi:protein-arginine kinase activator protein McsA